MSAASGAAIVSEMARELRRRMQLLNEVCVLRLRLKQKQGGRPVPENAVDETLDGVGSDEDGTGTETLARLSGDSLLLHNKWMLTCAPQNDQQFERFANAVRLSILSGERSSGASSANASRRSSAGTEAKADADGQRGSVGTDALEEGEGGALCAEEMPRASESGAVASPILFDVPRSSLFCQMFGSSSSDASSGSCEESSSSNRTSDIGERQEEEDDEAAAMACVNRMVLCGSPLEKLDPSTAGYVLSSLERAAKLARTDRSRAEHLIDESLELLRPSRVEEQRRRALNVHEIDACLFDEQSVCPLPVPTASEREPNIASSWR